MGQTVTLRYEEERKFHEYFKIFPSSLNQHKVPNSVSQTCSSLLFTGTALDTAENSPQKYFPIAKEWEDAPGILKTEPKAAHHSPKHATFTSPA